MQHGRRVPARRRRGACATSAKRSLCRLCLLRRHRPLPSHHSNHTESFRAGVCTTARACADVAVAPARLGLEPKPRRSASGPQVMTLIDVGQIRMSRAIRADENRDERAPPHATLALLSSITSRRFAPGYPIRWCDARAKVSAHRTGTVVVGDRVLFTHSSVRNLAGLALTRAKPSER